MKRPTTRVHGVHEVRGGLLCVSPEPIDVISTAGNIIPGTPREPILLARPRHRLRTAEEAMDPANYRESHDERTLAWLMRVVAAQRSGRNLVHEPEPGTIEIVLAAIPERAFELDLLAHGFTSRLATWTGRPDKAGRKWLREVEQRLPRPYVRPETWGQAPPTTIPPKSDADLLRRAEHVWLRWSAVLDEWLVLGGCLFVLHRRPLLDLGQKELLLQYERLEAGEKVVRDMPLGVHGRLPPMRVTRVGGCSGPAVPEGPVRIEIRLNLAEHPLIWPATITVGRRGPSITNLNERMPTRKIAGLAWEDLLDLRRLLRELHRESKAPGRDPAAEGIILDNLRAVGGSATTVVLSARTALGARLDPAIAALVREGRLVREGLYVSIAMTDPRAVPMTSTPTPAPMPAPTPAEPATSALAPLPALVPAVATAAVAKTTAASPATSSVAQALRRADIIVRDPPRDLHGLTLLSPADPVQLGRMRDALIAAGLAPVVANRRILVRDRSKP